MRLARGQTEHAEARNHQGEPGRRGNRRSHELIRDRAAGPADEPGLPRNTGIGGRRPGSAEADGRRVIGARQADARQRGGVGRVEDQRSAADSGIEPDEVGHAAAARRTRQENVAGRQPGRNTASDAMQSQNETQRPWPIELAALHCPVCQLGRLQQRGGGLFRAVFLHAVQHGLVRLARADTSCRLDVEPRPEAEDPAFRLGGGLLREGVFAFHAAEAEGGDELRLGNGSGKQKQRHHLRIPRDHSREG